MECAQCGSRVGNDVKYCPNCGADVGGQAAGGAAQNAQGSPDAHDRPGGQGGAGGGSHQQTPQGQGGGHRQPSRNQPAGTGQGPGASGSMLTRRRALAAGGGLAAIGAAGGWFFFLRDSGGPVGVVEESWEAWEAGNLAAYRELHYPESPARQDLSDATPEEWGAMEGTEYTMESREVREKTEGRAVVRETYVMRPSDGTNWRATWDVELRRHDGSWKIYEYRQQDSETLSG